MSLSSLYLDAFTEVARLKSFSQAAIKLHITQSALSQRVLNLEQEIGNSLFIRDPSGVRLTDLGQRLLRYCHSKNVLEAEFVESLKAQGEERGLSGLVRVSGFSTINRSVVLPLFAEFLKDNPQVHIELRTDEMRELPRLLFSGAVDMILVNDPIKKQEVENHLVGQEEYVLVQSSSKHSRRDLYLDSDEEDTFTLDFFKQQARGKIPIIQRNFLGDIYAIMDGVRLGLGRAVLPVHLIRDLKGVEVVSGYKPMRLPVHLCYYSQTFYTELQKQVIALLQNKVGDHLRN